MQQLLLNYYDKNKRDLPWRKTKDPYSIWISEIMCQQTRVETVIDYYNRFMKDYPSIHKLAKTNLDELNKHWQGLGYYSRAKNLLKAAKIIEEKFDGVFPTNYKDVLSLPGIGEYTASAICSMAYNQPYVSIDGNFFRVFSRYWKLDFDITQSAAKNELKEKLLPLLPKRSGDFNQAVMDLGATICLGYDIPKCECCPLKKKCKAHISHEESDYPFTSKKTKVKTFDYTILLIKENHHYVLHKRDNKGLLAGLYEFKNIEGFLDVKNIKKLFPDAKIQKGEIRNHHFSHQTWNMLPYIIETKHYQLQENEILVSKEEIIQKYSIPKCFNQFFDLIEIK